MLFVTKIEVFVRLFVEKPVKFGGKAVLVVKRIEVMKMKAELLGKTELFEG